MPSGSVCPPTSPTTWGVIRTSVCGSHEKDNDVELSNRIVMCAFGPSNASETEPESGASGREKSTGMVVVIVLCATGALSCGASVAVSIVTLVAVTLAAGSPWAFR